MWHEGTAGRGYMKIGLCLLRHGRSMSTSITHLILYSDLCEGQNRKVYLLSLCLYLHIIRNPNLPFDVINHKFMVPGHSYLPNDRDFGFIEQVKRRHQQIYTTQEWYDLVSNACHTNPFSVVVMTSADFVAIKELNKMIVNRKEDIMVRSVDWMSIQRIQVQKDTPLKFQFRQSLNELEAWKEVDRGKRKGLPSDLALFSPLTYS